MDVDHEHDAVAGRDADRLVAVGTESVILGNHHRNPGADLCTRERLLQPGEGRIRDGHRYGILLAEAGDLELFAGRAVEHGEADERLLALLEVLSITRDDLGALRLLGSERARELDPGLVAELPLHDHDVGRLSGGRLWCGRSGATGEGDGDEAGRGDERERRAH